MRLFAALLIAPAALLAQPAQLGPLESRPAHPEISSHRKPPSFAKRLPAAPVWRLGKLRQEEIDAVARDPRLTLKGFERQLDSNGPQRGQWQTLDDGRTVWRMALQAEGAVGLRVLFTRFDVGAGGVWVYSSDGSQVFGPYSGTGAGDAGSAGNGPSAFWSNTVFGDTLVVEYQPAGPWPDDGSNPSVPFAIARVSQMVAEEQAMAARRCCAANRSRRTRKTPSRT